MSNDAFNNFLTGKGYGPIMKDYQHASKLYVDTTYARAPKMGFLYFVELDINRAAVRDENWAHQDWIDVGLLAKKADLPKFVIANEVMNQYNRKTQVATKLSYDNISIEFHDDNSDITHNLWVNYYKNIVNDSNLDPIAFSNTKYSETNHYYGLYRNGYNIPFFNEINLYVLHQHNFTQYTLINPKIVNWEHDSVEQSSGNKILQNKMSIAYEGVRYNSGRIQPSIDPVGFSTVYYDHEPSPYSVAGLDAPVYDPRGASAFDTPGRDKVFGVSPGMKSNFDKRGTNRIYNAMNKPANPGFDSVAINKAYGVIRPQTQGLLQQLGTIIAKNYVNQNGLTRQKAVEYNIAGSVMGRIGSGPGKYSSPPSTEDQPGVFTLPGGVGINIFKGLNTTVDGSIRANPAAILFPPKN